MSFDPFLGLFDGGKPSLIIPDDDVMLPGTPRDPARRAANDSLWTYQDDLLLKQLVEKYPKNWGLVADLFNSSRGAISLEQRVDWECKERYRSRWLGKDRGERDFTPAAPSAQDGPSSSTSARHPQSQITTRKRMASVSSTTANSAPIAAPAFEPRKRRRHVLIFETMRKCAKKREVAQKASSMCLPFARFSSPDTLTANTRKAPAPTIHDTHGQFSKLPRLSPAELSHMKSEKEAKEMLSRRRVEEAQRQQLLQRMGNGTPGQSHVRGIVRTIRTLIHHLQAQPQVALAQSQGQGQGQPAQQLAQNNNAPRPQLNGQPVAQIRSQVNISQQRIPATNATRAQMLQVQAAQQRALNTNLAAGAPNISTPHLSPGFSQRAPVSSSPVVSHSSPPRTSTTPNPPRPPSASQHQGHAQPSPNLAHVAAARQNPAPGMYFSPIHGVQFTPEQMEHAMRLQLMVSGAFHLHCKPEASTAMTQ